MQTVFHYGPVLALTVISIITTSTIHATLWLAPPSESTHGALNLAIFLAFVLIIVFSFLRAIYTGAGASPRGWVRPSLASVFWFGGRGREEGGQ